MSLITVLVLVKKYHEAVTVVLSIKGRDIDNQQRQNLIDSRVPT